MSGGIKIENFFAMSSLCCSLCWRLRLALAWRRRMAFLLAARARHGSYSLYKWWVLGEEKGREVSGVQKLGASV